MADIQLENEVSKSNEAEPEDNNVPSSLSPLRSRTDKLLQPITGFLVNKGAIPLDKETWNLMLERIKSTHPQGEKVIDDLNSKELDFIRGVTKATSPQSAVSERQENTTSTEQGTRNLEKYGDISIAVEPKFSPLTSDLQKLAAVQRYLNRLQYNHTGMQFFNIKKSRSITRLYETAKEMIKYSLPIKCLEAVVLSLYLTSNIKTISRFTIRFKTKSGKNTHKHIVLGIFHNSCYGALGLSRRKTLMDKPIKFTSLPELILDYKKCYEECFHTLVKVKLSPCLSPDLHSNDVITWNYFTLSVYKMTVQEIKQSLEKYSREMKKHKDACL